MAKERVVFVCSNCGAQMPKWSGRCPDCSQWNTIAEEVVQPERGRKLAVSQHNPQALDDITVGEDARTPTGIQEFDRILGGGMVSGSSVLIGGDPGIGKSTLLLQVAASVARRGLTALYVTAEESPLQLKMRAERLGVTSGKLLVLAETSLEAITRHVRRISPQMVIVDSIQMVYKSDVPSAPGSVTQVRECATELVYLARQTGATVVLIGHVTKEGALAGPRLLEHIVDTVLYFEGDRFQFFRILRANKNRFGATDEIGIFRMQSDGLVPVENPSALFMNDAAQSRPGSVVTAAIEGTRPLMVELQALVVPCAFGTPRRRVTGVDLGRTSMVLAVLEKHGELQLASQDVFVNVAGGVRVSEPASDLAVALSVAGSFLGTRLPERTIAVGELGLDGEPRPVGQTDRRLGEAERLGFTQAIIPARTVVSEGLKLRTIPVKTISQAIQFLERS